MASIRGTNTGPEVRLRKALWKAGHRYVLHARLPGRPDLLFVAARVAVFVDGCFWHRCPKHMTRPKSNARFWRLRLDGNVQRDQRVNLELKGLGYEVLRFWEHEVEERLPTIARRIEKTLQGRSALRRPKGEISISMKLKGARKRIRVFRDLKQSLSEALPTIKARKPHCG